MRFINVNAILTTLISVLACLMLGELLVRITARTPVIPPQHLKFEPVIYQHDAQIGWINKPGRYKIPPYTSDSETIDITINRDGSRATSVHDNENHSMKQTFVFLGGSYTQAWAISDEASFAWQLQNLFPQTHIVNYGTGGYGTYQSYLLAQNYLHNYTPNTQFVYFYVDFHADRNVATVEWLQALSVTARRGHVNLPYISLDESSQLEYHLPESYLMLPLRQHSALVAFIERMYMKTLYRDRQRNKEHATQKIIQEMNNMLKRHKMGFSVVILNAASDNINNLIPVLNQGDIPVKNCNIKLTQQLRVKGEGHPNELANQQWTQCIASFIKQHLLTESLDDKIQN